MNTVEYIDVTVAGGHIYFFARSAVENTKCTAFVVTGGNAKQRRKAFREIKRNVQLAYPGVEIRKSCRFGQKEPV